MTVTQRLFSPETTSISSSADYHVYASRAAGMPSSTLNEVLLRSFDVPPPKSIVEGQRSLDELLFDALATFKVHLATVAMHLSREERDALHRQLDNLLDSDEWDPRDAPPTVASFKTFVRLVLSKKPVRHPSVGATYCGHLLAAWLKSDGSRATIECAPNDCIRWSVRIRLEHGQAESAAGESSLDRLEAVLAPYGGSRLMD